MIDLASKVRGHVEEMACLGINGYSLIQWNTVSNDILLLADQLAAAEARVARLEDAMPRLVDALRCFLEDQRFHVSVGGNPIAVEQMIAEARAAVEAGEELGGQKDG